MSLTWEGSLRSDDADRFELTLDRAEQADPIFLNADPSETAAQRRYREWSEFAEFNEWAERSNAKDPYWCYFCDRPKNDCACDRDERDDL